MTTTPPLPRSSGGLATSAVPVRIYAPVGEHRDLLAYLVRRLLENGANSSFVHQLADDAVDIDTLLASPLVPSRGAFAADAARALRQPPQLARCRPRLPGARSNPCSRPSPPRASRRSPRPTPAQIDAAMARLQAAAAAWNARGVAARAAILRRAADALEARMAEFCGLLVKEARKTLGDCVAEVREAVDFLRYYADEAEAGSRTQALPGPTGESNELRLHGRGVFVCISPWNFPLAIFAGQVAAALVAGNAVAAKPAEQTPAVAARMVALLHEAGVPADALALLHGPGETVGAALVADARTAGVCFTGSTAVAKIINRALAAQGRPDRAADRRDRRHQRDDRRQHRAARAGGRRRRAERLSQRRPALLGAAPAVRARGDADGVIEMIAGALAELQVGDPALLATDVGPVIDAEAQAAIAAPRRAAAQRRRA